LFVILLMYRHYLYGQGKIDMYSACGYNARGMATKRRKKVRKEVRKDLSIQIRVTSEQKKSLNEAATKLGLGLSGWMLSTCLQAAAALKARETET
jgi:hypothetical protein